MTKAEIRAILKDSIRDDWIKFKDKSDKEYFLKLIKYDDLEEIFSSLEVSTIIKGKEVIEDMREEYEALWKEPHKNNKKTKKQG